MSYILVPHRLTCLPAATIILLQTAPIGFAAVGWKYFLLVICWSVFFVILVYLYWPETARLSLEEIGKQFGDEVAVHLIDATDEERAALDRKLAQDPTEEDNTPLTSTIRITELRKSGEKSGADG